MEIPRSDPLQMINSRIASGLASDGGGGENGPMKVFLVGGAVRDRLLRNPGQIPDMEEVAAEMRMTSRTLRRHLQQLNTSFQHLLDEVRAALDEAKEAMEDDAKDAAGFTVARV